ncbi:MAG: ATP-binding protein [Bacteroidales bacterium]|nr:ATP-binding protein [Bacteroidales bacterium]
MAKTLKKLRIESVMSNLRKVEHAIDEITANLKIKQDNYGKILVATLEAVNNAIKHGNRNNPEKTVDVVISLNGNEMTIEVTDQGEGFDPASVPDPTRPENIEELSGRGIFLMSKLADSISFNKIGNSVTMTFREIYS